jgi:hypothetical protein
MIVFDLGCVGGWVCRLIKDEVNELLFEKWSLTHFYYIALSD